MLKLLPFTDRVMGKMYSLKGVWPIVALSPLQTQAIASTLVAR